LLRHFAEVYDRILETRDEEAFGRARLRGDRHRRVRRRYHDYIEQQRAEFPAMLEQLPALQAGGRL
jgi:hypothetical protein